MTNFQNLLLLMFFVIVNLLDPFGMICSRLSKRSMILILLLQILIRFLCFGRPNNFLTYLFLCFKVNFKIKGPLFVVLRSWSKIIENVNTLLQNSVTITHLINADLSFSKNCGHWICVGEFYSYFIYSRTFVLILCITWYLAALFFFVIICDFLQFVFDFRKKWK